jgi:acyl phosphate:glycerol-3-phosphate acyltransferase
MHPTQLLLALIGGYLIGSIPIAYLVAKVLTGRDIRRLGTGNVGVMNTIRHAGFPAGMLVFAAEGAKGTAAFGLGRYVGNGDQRILVACCIAALLGVNWSVFLGFSGGRGTTLSAFIVALVAWKAVLLGAVVWLVVYLALRDSFLATRINILLLPLTAFITTQDFTLAAGAFIAGLILLSRHRRETDDRVQLAHSHATIDPGHENRR